MPILFHNSLQQVLPSDGAYAHDGQDVVVALSHERQVTLLECFRLNITQPSNDYIRSYSHTVCISLL